MGRYTEIMKSDLEIAHEAELLPIGDIAHGLEIPDEYIKPGNNNYDYTELINDEQVVFVDFSFLKRFSKENFTYNFLNRSFRCDDFIGLTARKSKEL